MAQFDRDYNVYRGVSQASGEAWQSKLRIRYGMQVIDTAMVNMVSGKPRVIVRPRNPHDVAAAKAMQALMDYYIAEDHLVDKQPVFVQQGLIFGVTVAKNHWVTQKCVRTMKMPSDTLLDKQGRPALIPRKIEYLERDGPTFEPWSVYDCWWDPDARDPDAAEYMVLRSYVSPDQLRALAINEDAGTGVYRNVEDAITAARSPSPGTAQTRRNATTKNKDKIELHEYWRQTPSGLRVTVVCAGSNTLLRDDETPYWHGKKPIVVAQVRPDLFEMAGIADTDLVDHIQQALWTTINRRQDQLNLTVLRGITYREGGVTDPNALELRPNFKWPVSDHDDVQPFNVQPLPPEAYQEESNLLGQLQLVTGINPYISGSNLDTVDQNTATGVTALQEVASRLLRFKASLIANQGYQRTYEQWSEMIMQLQDREIAVEIMGPEGSTWQTYGPHEIVGSYQTTLEGSEESLSRQQERGEAIALLNAFAPLVQTGTVNVKPLLERVAAAYNFPSAEALLNPAPQAPAPAAPNGNGARPAPQGALQDGTAMDPRILSAINNGQ